MGSRIEVPREFYREVPLLGQTTTLGATVRAQFSGLENQYAGHPVHVLGFFLRIVATFTTVANTMAAVCPGEKLYNAAAQINFKVGDHFFVRAMRGAVMKALERALALRSVTGSVASDLADADATTSSITLDYYIPCALPRPCPGGELDGAIPLAALRDSDFDITLGSASSIPHTGVSLASIVSCNLYARLTPLSKLRVPTAWTYRERRSTDLIFTEEGSGFWDVAQITLLSTESDSMNCANFTGIRLSIGSATLRDTTTALLSIAHNTRQILTDGGADTESTTAPENLYLVEPVSTNPGKLMTRQPRGPLKLEITARPASVTQTDLAYRARGTRYPQYFAEMAKRLGCEDPTKASSRVRVSKKGSIAADLVPSYDTQLSWPGMPFEVPNANQR